MGLYAPSAAGMIHSDTDDLVRLIQQGDGMGWPGDPRMYLAIGVLTRKKRGQTKQGRRYEVWRYCEDGEDRMIAHWRLEERDRIIFDLARMRLDAPGHIDSSDAIDANNAAIERAAEEQAQAKIGEWMEHGAKLLHDLTNPRNVFRGMPGQRDAE